MDSPKLSSSPPIGALACTLPLYTHDNNIFEKLKNESPELLIMLQQSNLFCKVTLYNVDINYFQKRGVFFFLNVGESFAQRQPFETSLKEQTGDHFCTMAFGKQGNLINSSGEMNASFLTSFRDHCPRQLRNGPFFLRCAHLISCLSEYI